MHALAEPGPGSPWTALKSRQEVWSCSEGTTAWGGRSSEPHLCKQLPKISGGIIGDGAICLRALTCLEEAFCRVLLVLHFHRLTIFVDGYNYNTDHKKRNPLEVDRSNDQDIGERSGPMALKDRFFSKFHMRPGLRQSNCLGAQHQERSLFRLQR